MAETGTPYKRINFFRGFLTTEDDWNDAERYHVEKRKLHNRMFHGPGVVPGFLGDLRVSSRGKGDLSMEVSPGYATDGVGNDIILWETQIKTINPLDYKLPQTIYVVLKYFEDKTDYITYKENLDYKGHRRVAELAKVEFSIVEPDLQREVEVARVHLQKDARRIFDAKDPTNPQANEIDLRYVPRAGVYGSFMDAKSNMMLRRTLLAKRRAFGQMARAGVASSRSAYDAAVTLEMLYNVNSLDFRNINDCLRTMVEMEYDVVRDIETNHPVLAGRKEFQDFRKNVEIMNGLIAEAKRGPDYLETLLAYQAKSCEAINQIYAGEAPAEAPSEPGAPAAAPRPTSTKDEWDDERIKVHSGEFPQSIKYQGREFVLKDHLDVIEKASEEEHAFSIEGASDTYRTRQRLKYPDGAVVEDVGIAHVNGWANWTVKNMVPKKDVLMICRIDYVHGDYSCDIHANDQLVGELKCDGSDRRFRWRNWPYLIGAKFVTAKELKMKQSAKSADRDVNMFRFWFFQQA